MRWETAVRRALVLVAAAALALAALGLVLILGTGLLGAAAVARLSPASLRALTQALLLSAGVAAAGAFLMAGGLARLLAGRLTRRLTAIITWSRQMGRPEGDPGLPIDDPDEFGELAYALTQAHGQLRAAVTTREQFFSTVAHDLRTPLAAVQGQLEAMMTGCLPSDPETLARLHTDVGRLGRLAEDLLLLYQAETGGLRVDRRRGDVAPLTRQVAERLEIVARDRGITLIVDAPPSLIGWIDGDRMDRVLTNLLANALTYCPRGSLVTLRLDPDPEGIEWHVIDNGPGIPPAIRNRATDALVRGDPARGPGHLGLGLSIARAWVQAHDGRLVITSDAQGTRVRVVVPAGPPAAPAADPQPRPGPRSEGGPGG